MKIQVVGSFFLIACLLTGCADSEKLESAPPNALFCKNITENVQTIQHLHLPATPENSIWRKSCFHSIHRFPLWNVVHCYGLRRNFNRKI